MRITEHQGRGLAYLAVEPDSYDADSPDPLVVLLHGFGANMRDLAGLCPLIGARALYVFPNGPITVGLGLGLTGSAWAPLDGHGISGHVDRAERLIAGLFEDVVDRYRVDRERVILGGFSQGGMMAYRCALASPGTYRGLVALSAWIHDPDGLRRRLPSDRAQPIFVAHGTADPLIPVEDGRKAVRFLEAEGYAPEYREYPMGHEINQEVASDLARWVSTVLSAAEVRRPR